MNCIASSTPELHPAIRYSGWLLACAAALSAQRVEAGDCSELIQHSFKSLQTGETKDLCEYRDKVLLVVNTASYCAFTDQYGGLEDLYRRYKDRGLVVVGFPSNDFGSQEPGSDAKIDDFCRLTYGVEFPMAEKSSVVGPGRNALYKTLGERTGVSPRWNFHKYLIDRSGNRVVSFDSTVTPDDPRIVREMQVMLDALCETVGGSGQSAGDRQTAIGEYGEQRG
jgi:glutathione peroxidase